MSDNPMNESVASWSFFSNYGHVIVCLADNPLARLRDVADHVGVTERTAFRLVSKLEAADILKRVKAGRRNRYLINLDAHLLHRLESHCTVGELLAVVLDEPAQTSSTGHQ
jgi:DNA-binding Lrp family transcriptional regulator